MSDKQLVNRSREYIEEGTHLYALILDSVMSWDIVWFSRFRLRAKGHGTTLTIISNRTSNSTWSRRRLLVIRKRRGRVRRRCGTVTGRCGSNCRRQKIRSGSAAAEATATTSGAGEGGRGALARHGTGRREGVEARHGSARACTVGNSSAAAAAAATGISSARSAAGTTSASSGNGPDSSGEFSWLFGY
jgi:hypothetical protein